MIFRTDIASKLLENTVLSVYGSNTRHSVS